MQVDTNGETSEPGASSEPVLARAGAQSVTNKRTFVYSHGMTTDDHPLAGRVALVAGATRGCGRAIAIELGALGATVYCSGRSTRAGRSPMDRPETIEDTAELVTAAGGEGVAVRCDHADADDVGVLVGRIRSDHARLDILSTTSGAGILSSSGASRCGNTRSTRPSASCATASRRT